MALFTYLDASGDASQPTLCAAGLIAREEQWIAFDRDWGEALAQAEVSAFHMKEFAHSVGEFSSWKGDEPRRAAFLARLGSITKRHTAKHVASTLIMDAYNRFNDQFTIRESIGSPYVLTMFTAVMSAAVWGDTNAPSEPMAIFLEAGDEGQRILVRELRRNKFEHPVTILPKKAIVDGAMRYVLPFQAADFLAYEYQKAMRTMLERGVIEIDARKSILNLVPEGKDLHWRTIGAPAMKDFCDFFRVRRRR